MHETMALVPISPNSLILYDNSFQVAGRIADQASQYDAFSAYHQSTTTNTRRQQRRTLEAFSSYLASAGIPRSADDLYYDPEAWRGMSYGILRGFVTRSLHLGYSVGTINAWLTRSQRDARSRLSARSLKGRSSTRTVVASEMTVPGSRKKGTSRSQVACA